VDVKVGYRYLDVDDSSGGFTYDVAMAGARGHGASGHNGGSFRETFTDDRTAAGPAVNRA
jgi:hypothetical protein